VSVSVFVGVSISFAVLGAIMLLVSISLVIGAKKCIPALLVPWMVYTIVFLITNTVLYILDAAQYFAFKYIAAGTGNIVAAIIYLLLNLYFLLVVYSRYRELKDPPPSLQVFVTPMSPNPAVYNNIIIIGNNNNKSNNNY
jgi:uncharacterized membrane protein YesL